MAQCSMFTSCVRAAESVAAPAEAREEDVDSAAESYSSIPPNGELKELQ